MIYHCPYSNQEVVIEDKYCVTCGENCEESVLQKSETTRIATLVPLFKLLYRVRSGIALEPDPAMQRTTDKILLDSDVYDDICSFLKSNKCPTCDDIGLIEWAPGHTWPCQTCNGNPLDISVTTSAISATKETK